MKKKIMKLDDICKLISVHTYGQPIVIKPTDGASVIIYNSFFECVNNNYTFSLKQLECVSSEYCFDNNVIDFGIKMREKIRNNREPICIYLNRNINYQLELFSSVGKIQVHGVRLDNCYVRSMSGDVSFYYVWAKRLKVTKKKGDLRLSYMSGDLINVNNQDGYTQVHHSLNERIYVKTMFGDIDTHLLPKSCDYRILVRTNGNQGIDPYCVREDHSKVLCLDSDYGNVNVIRGK